MRAAIRTLAGKRVGMVMLGCDKNRVDGERLLGELQSGGYEPGGDARGRLDLLIVNTCSFIGPARRESIDAIRKAVDLKDAGKVGRIAVAGCFAPALHRAPEAAPDLLDGLRSRIDFFIGPGDLERAVQIVTGREEAHFRPPARTLKPGPRVLTGNPGTAFVKIAEGCDKGCSFCTIPSLRGKFVSRAPGLILDEIRALVAVGVREIVFVSQDTAHWGRDRGSTLAALVRKLEKVAGEFPAGAFRVRLHYLYPSQVTPDLIDAVADSSVVVPYWDVPIQHAAEPVLRAMRRPSRPEALARLVDGLRGRFPECAIRTTVMTGHPGETRRAFATLLRFLRDHEFDRVGVFPFIPEPGTPAATMRQIRGGSAEAEERASIVLELQGSISERRLRERIGREYDVLMDTQTEGRSALEAPEVDGVIRVGGEHRPGTMVRVRITASDRHDLQAVPVEVAPRDVSAVG